MQISHSKLRLFADDSIIYRDIKTQDDCLRLQQDLDSAARWEADWLVAFHREKCTKLTVSKKKKPIQQSSKLDFRIYWPENFKIRIFI
jgi:hypothetical protein